MQDENLAARMHSRAAEAACHVSHTAGSQENLCVALFCTFKTLG